MDEALRKWLNDEDERAIDDAFFDSGCRHFFAVDWGEDDADIVDYCADCLEDDSLCSEWRDDLLVIIRNGKETIVPLADDEGDRYVTICTLNDVLRPDYEIRFLVCSHGSDTAGFAALPAADWRSLDTELPNAVQANFIKLRELPNVFTEMTDQHLPEAAHARFQRMLERSRRS